VTSFCKTGFSATPLTTRSILASQSSKQTKRKQRKWPREKQENISETKKFSPVEERLESSELAQTNRPNGAAFAAQKNISLRFTASRDAAQLCFFAAFSAVPKCKLTALSAGVAHLFHVPKNRGSSSRSTASATPRDAARAGLSPRRHAAEPSGYAGSISERCCNTSARQGEQRRRRTRVPGGKKLFGKKEWNSL